MAARATCLPTSKPSRSSWRSPASSSCCTRSRKASGGAVGNIFVHINGDNPHTKIQTALNRLSIRSGEIADIREIRRASGGCRPAGCSCTDPARGVMPKITYHIPELDETEMAEGEGGPGFRGQSPDEYSPRSRGGAGGAGRRSARGTYVRRPAADRAARDACRLCAIRRQPMRHVQGARRRPVSFLRDDQIDVHVYLDRRRRPTAIAA